MNEVKRVLLTGASGFVGSHVLEYLLQKTNWEITCVCSWEHKGTPERILDSKIYQEHKDRVKIVTHDLSVPFTETTTNNIGKVNYILNLASESHVDRSISDPVGFIKNNTGIALTMLEFARKVKPEVFLQFSTDEVYGPAFGDEKHHEWSRMIPSNPYSASKACQESIAISYWRTYGVPVIIVNTMNIFGERQDSEKYIAQIIKNIHNKKTIKIYGSKDNVGSRIYLYAQNVSDALFFILENIKPKIYKEGSNDVRPEKFNIEGDYEIDNYELPKKIAEIMDQDFDYEFVDVKVARPGYDKKYSIDGSKLKKAGWKPPISFEEGMKKTINWTLDNPKWL